MSEKQKRKRRKRTKTPGVTIFRRTLPSGKTVWVGQYCDPKSDKVKTLALSTIKITTVEQAQTWAQKKSERIIEEKAVLKVQRLSEEPLTELTVAELIKRYDEHNRKDLSPRTLTDRLNRHVKNFTDWLESNHEHPVPENALSISRRHLLGFRKFVCDEKASVTVKGGKRNDPKFKKLNREREATSINVILRSVKAVLNWAIDARLVGLTREDTRVGLKMVKQKRPQKRWLKPEELRALVGAAMKLDGEKVKVTRKSKAAGKAWQGEMPAKYEPILPMLLLFLLGGFRKAELLQLRWKNVDLERGTITVAYNDATGWAPKVNEERTVTLSPSPLMKETLEKLKEENEGAIYVIGGGKPAMISKQAWKRLLTNAKLENVRVKDLRSTCASYQVCSPTFGRVPHLVASRMGHSVTTLFNNYAGLIHDLKGFPTLEEEMGIAELFDDANAQPLVLPIADSNQSIGAA